MSNKNCLPPTGQLDFLPRVDQPTPSFRAVQQEFPGLTKEMYVNFCDLFSNIGGTIGGIIGLMAKMGSDESDLYK